MKEVPVDLQTIIKKNGYKSITLDVEVGSDFTCPTNWSDYNSMQLIMLNRKTGLSKIITSRNYESYVNFTKEELAIYHGTLSCVLEEHMIAILIQSYPKSCTIFCNPGIIAKKLEQKIQLQEKQLLCLFITRSCKASYRLEEAKQFGFTPETWTKTKLELSELKLLTKRGALTLSGTNQAQGLQFYP